MSENDFVNRWSAQWAHHPDKDAITAEFKKELHELNEPLHKECERLLADVWNWNEKVNKLQQENDSLKHHWMQHAQNSSHDQDERSH